MQPLVIITDMTAHGDNSIAIALLASSATVSIQSIIATSGNVWAEEAAANVRHLLRKFRRRTFLSRLDNQRRTFAPAVLPITRTSPN